MADQVIDQIKQRIDILELLQDYLKLTKAGSNWRALCPFHHETSPSFMVSQDKQIWHCFGCDKGGDIFAFIQEMEGVDFPEALRVLANKAGVTLTNRRPEDSNYKQLLLQIVATAQQFYQHALLEANEAATAREYLLQRGITTTSIQQFGLGYSYQDWNKLLHHLKQHNYKETDIAAAGLIIQQTGGGGYYDRFRGRVMIPLHDNNGTVVGFTARTLQANEPGGKYINSPQSLIYDKSHLVYGLCWAKSAIKKLNASIVVEGNMDVIMAQQSGFPNVIGTSGTAFTEQQLLLLKRYSPNLLLAFDMDLAGQKAAERGIDLALQHGMNIKVIQLPQQFKDPDECIRSNPTAFKEAIRQARHIIDFWFIHVTQPLQLSRVEHKKKAVEQLLPVIAKIKDPVEQSHYIQQLADLVRVDPAILRDQLHRQVQQSNRASRQPSVSNAEPVVTKTAHKTLTKLDRLGMLSRQAVALLLTLPDQIKYCADYLDPAFIQDDTLQELYKGIIDQYNNTGLFATPDVEPYTSIINTLQLWRDAEFPQATTADLQKELILTIRELHKGYIIHRLRDIEVLMKQAEISQQLEQIEQLLPEFQLLTQQLTQLNKSTS